MRAALAIALACSAACAPAAEPVAGQTFDPVQFFRGRTHGDGTLKVILKPSKTITVDSVGTKQGDGTLLLKQVIREEGKEPRTRYWRMRKTGSGYSGTLTDAAGPVSVVAERNAVRIRYKGKDNLDFDQRLTATGPKTVSNRMKVRRFGIVVANFDEVIRKLD